MWLKKLRNQVMVITGASSGIGLVAARKAAANGARVMLAALSGETLRQVVEKIRARGGEADYVVTDVTKQEDVQRLADETIKHFGGFDTWVNSAAVSIYGPIHEVPIEDHRQVFETSCWGVVYGSLVAIPHLREKGGALINIGSVLSDRAITLQGPYCASQHAVKGFTDALRMDLELQKAPIAARWIRPPVRGLTLGGGLLAGLQYVFEAADLFLDNCALMGAAKRATVAPIGGR